MLNANRLGWLLLGAASGFLYFGLSGTSVLLVPAAVCLLGLSATLAYVRANSPLMRRRMSR